MPLKNRAMQIPGGLKYMQSETSFVPARYSSFDSIVQQVIAHRLANPWLVQKNGLATDQATVEMEVDQYNTNFCRQMGGQYLEYLQGGPPSAIPFQPPPPPPQILSPLQGGVAAVKKLASGVAVLFDWQESGEAPVAKELSAKRAAICSTCPKNVQSALTEYITGPLSEGFRRRLSVLNSMNLTTPSDDKLFGCDACLCPLRLKVHSPIQIVLKRLTHQVRSELVPQCWILSEEASPAK